jgi:hypothetical protein
MSVEKKKSGTEVKKMQKNRIDGKVILVAGAGFDNLVGVQI